MSHSLFSLRNLGKLATGRVPGQVIFQLTDACNARCPQCEMRVTHRYDRHEVDDDVMARSLTAAAEAGVAAVSFTGGEPFLQQEALLRWIGFAHSLGIPAIRTGTNGFFLRHSHKAGFERKVSRIASRLSDAGLRNLWFSIDSADPQVHETMRGMPGVIEGMRRALPIFESHGLWPTANLGINRNLGGEPLMLPPGADDDAKAAFEERCASALREFFDRILDLGFTIVNFCYPMSVESEPTMSRLGAIYRASSADEIVSFRRDEKALLFSALSRTVAEYRHRLRIFTPRSALATLIREHRDGPLNGASRAYPCRGGRDFFFVSAADGNVYPCGFRSQENLGKLWQLPADHDDPTAPCTRCDWECFRDPSEVLGPLLEMPRHPIRLLRRMRQDRTWGRLWRQDLRYQRACRFFDGRRPPEPNRLRAFAPQ